MILCTKMWILNLIIFTNAKIQVLILRIFCRLQVKRNNFLVFSSLVKVFLCFSDQNEAKYFGHKIFKIFLVFYFHRLSQVSNKMNQQFTSIIYHPIRRQKTIITYEGAYLKQGIDFTPIYYSILLYRSRRAPFWRNNGK